METWARAGQRQRPLTSPSTHRTKLLESEAMNESLRRSLSRASARSPYALGASPGGPALGSPASSMEDASEVIRRAKQDLERLKKKEVRQRRKR